MSEGQTNTHAGRLGAEITVFGLIGQLLASYIPEGFADVEQLALWKSLLELAMPALVVSLLQRARNKGQGGMVTGAAPLRSKIGVSSLAMILTVGLVLPGCGKFVELTPTGRYDVALTAATSLLEEVESQTSLVRADTLAGHYSAKEGLEIGVELGRAHKSLSTAITLAQTQFDLGADPGTLASSLNAAAAGAQKALREEYR